jgi:hypothetical protein
MDTPDGTRIAGEIRRKVDEFRRLCEGIDNETASRAPEGRWSPKQIVSHLLGGEGAGLRPVLNAFLDQDTPRLDLEPGNDHFTEDRARMSFGELLKAFEAQYGNLADFVARLPSEQLSRKAHMPALKDSPLGEYPTLGVFVSGLAGYHIAYHRDHMAEILTALGVVPKP